MDVIEKVNTKVCKSITAVPFLAPLVFTLVFFLQTSCIGQQKFDEFVNKFPVVNLPIDSIPLLTVKDTLHVSSFNYIVWESQPKEGVDGKLRTVRPKVYKNGKLSDLTGFGKVNDTPLKHRSVDGKTGQFFTSVYAVARINMNPEYVTLIVKTYNSELAYYDLYNFTATGTRLSVVPLFKYSHDKMFVDSMDYVYIRSSILKDGTIVWFESNRGVNTSRAYKLRDDGYFEIIEEEKTGKFEY